MYLGYPIAFFSLAVFDYETLDILKPRTLVAERFIEHICETIFVLDLPHIGGNFGW